jgi:phospholipase D1/2
MTAPSPSQPLRAYAAPARLCRPGDTCWVRLPARRIAFLVDADAYYRALHDTLLAARANVWIVGWDVHARTRLRVGAAGAQERGVGELGPLLDFLARRRRGLRIHVLEWDYSVLFARERGLAPWVDLDWRTHPRVKFLLDDRHPLGASLHEKIVVVDDTVAFVGGLDLTVRRWDTSEHRGEDPRRVDPWGRPYEPFHDVQMMVEGEVARAIAERVRRRWNELSATRIRRLPPREGSPWPPSVTPDASQAIVAVARTETGPPAVREIERLHLEAIRSARASIYVENQYFSAEVVADALCQRLAEPEGPEVVLVLPISCSGWLEDWTMGARRALLLEKLRKSDRHGRFRAYAPQVPGAERVNVHAKLMIVDDVLARIGSANLSNRSLGLDRECDLALESEGRRDVSLAIVRLRTRLLGEHLGVTPERFDAASREHGGSLIGTIEALRRGTRTLVPHGARTLVPLEPKPATSAWLALPVDPAEPAERWEPLARWTPDELRDPHRRSALLGLAGALVFALLVALGWLVLQEGAPVAARIPRDTPVALGAGIALAVALGVQLLLPVTGMLLVALLTLGPALGGFWTLLGAMAGALGGWSLGRYWIGHRIERIAPARIAAFRHRLRERRILDVTAVRLAPLLPFAIGNLAAGAARVRLPEFLLGTLLALLPLWAMLASVCAGVRALRADPSPATAAALLLAVAVSLVAFEGLRRWSRRRHAG